ncbi:MAG: nicotinamide riboside transporter PnuC [Flavobacteriaceae bacterium]|nr:nicotinamide riboside transporter PnuC [Flavobacteriaceae bacterium]
MDLHKIFLAPYENYSPIQIFLEILATATGILSVYFSIKKNIWVYPSGIVSTALYIYIFFVFGLWGDGIINIYYTIMSVYGWILWSKNSEDRIHVEISKTTKKDRWFSAVLFVISIFFVMLVYYYKPFVENSFSMQNVNLGFHHLDWANWMDVFTTSVFLVGMWLMAKRKIENWIFWIIGDLICIPMTYYKGLGITSLQYIVFTIMAIKGYMEWKKSLADS